MAGKHWPSLRYAIKPSEKNPHEAKLLMLDCSKARAVLAWTPVWDAETAFARTIMWYRSVYSNNVVNTNDDLDRYCSDAAEKEAVWTR